MIEIKNLTKKFGKTVALDNISFSVPNGSIFGLVGSNGAGKSTVLRILSGVFEPDNGNAYIDENTPFENIKLKENIAFVSDYPYFLPASTLDSMAKYYKSIYSNWNNEKYNYLKTIFPIESKQKISTMSKGMQRQSAIILSLSYMPKYILFDEIFDGLDPVIRELVKKIIIEYVDETGATIVISSHNLRELEGFCDHIGFLHKGGILLQKDINSESLGVFRTQFVLSNENDFEKIKQCVDIVKEARQGKMIELTVRGSETDFEDLITSLNPVFYEILPLTLEELFISEMEVAGYDINNIF